MLNIWVGLSLLWLMPIAAMAEVRSAAATEFVLHHEAIVKAPPAQAYRLAVQVGKWWSGAHSYPGDAKNLRLDARAGGCWCENWGDNSVAHGRVLAARLSQMLRVDAPLGPLQAMPVQAILTISFKPVAGGTRLAFDYTVAGPASLSLDKLAPIVDGVIGEQFTRLAALANGGDVR